MSSLAQKSGRLAFWLAYPALWVYLIISQRTRVLLVVGGQVLVVKGWIGTGKWQLPGGGLHSGEDSAQGAVRELLEETSVKLNPSQVKFFYKSWYKQKGIRFRYSCYSCVLVTKPVTKKQPREIMEVAWLPLLSIDTANATSDTFQAVKTWLKAPNLL